MDLGGTKLAVALFSESGKILSKETIALERRSGSEVGELISEQVKKHKRSEDATLKSIGVSVPGIAHNTSGTVWAPNIPGWEDYPLLSEIKKLAGDAAVNIDSDRACSILGELWQGNAKNCKDAIFLAVGTGIGAGILINGNILRGAHDIAGAVGWMALHRPYLEKYVQCGCFEYYASGEGIAKYAREILQTEPGYTGSLRKISPDQLTAHHVFEAQEKNDPVASKVMDECIVFWGMAAANLISIFNPEKIIFGGGVFGPATRFIDRIRQEAVKWAQPISATKVSFEKSGLSGDAAIYGAGFLALKNLKH